MPSVTLRNAIDTYASGTATSTNYAGATVLHLRTGDRYAYVFFNRAAPLGARITSAKLRLYHAASWSGSRTITVERISATWKASRLTWNNKPGVTGTPVTVTDTGGAAGTVIELTVTSMLQTVSDGSAWYGFRITTDDATDRGIYSAQGLSAYRPTLEVTWTEAPQQPTDLSPSGNRAVSTSKPVLRFGFTDELGDTTLAAAQVQIDPAANWTTPAFDTGEVATSNPELDLAAVTANLIANPSFETDTTGWAGVNCTIARSTAQAQSGVASLALTATVAAEMRAETSGSGTSAIPVSPGGTYTASAWYRAATTIRSCWTRIVWYDSAGATISQVGTGTVNNTNTGWTQHSITEVAPTNAAYAKVRAIVGGPPAIGEVHYTDNLQLSVGTVAYAGLADLASTYWRVRVKDGAGLWSAWSEDEQYKRDDLGTVTITNPGAGGLTYAQEVTADAPLASYKLGDTNTTLNDSSGNGRHGTYTATPTTAASLGLGFTGLSTDFNVTPFYAEVLDAAWMPNSGDLTLEATVEWPAAPDSAGGIVGRYADSGTNASWCLRRNAATNSVQFIVRNGGDAGTGSAISSPATLVAGTKYHFMATKIGTAMKLYVNGAEVASGTHGGGAFNSTKSLEIGRFANTSREIRAKVQEVHVYGTGLSAARVLAHYNASIVAPPSGTVLSDPTPPFLWTFAGATQKAWQVLVVDPADPSEVIADSGKQTGTDVAWTPPSKKLTGDGPYRVKVRVWDTVDREYTPGAYNFAEATRDFTMAPDGSVTGVTGLTATQPDVSKPRIKLTWTRPSAPDRYVVRRDGVVIEDSLLPEDALDTGTTYEFEDDEPRVNRSHTWKVQAVVNNKASDSDTVTAVPKQRGIWLLDKGLSLEVWIAGQEGGTWVKPEEASVFAPVGGRNVVRRIQGRRGYEGSLSGPLVDQYGKTAAQWETDLMAMRDRPTRAVVLALGDLSITVILGNVTTYPLPNHSPPIRVASFDFWQVLE